LAVYTRRGDGGQTSLRTGQRVGKDDARVTAYGTVDEAGSAIGLARAMAQNATTRDILHQIQGQLLQAGAELSIDPGEGGAGVKTLIVPENVNWLETTIDSLENKLPPIKSFVVPGDTPSDASLHLARTTVRRAERLLAGLARTSAVSPVLLQYFNRLSDLLFVLSRWEKHEAMVSRVKREVLSRAQSGGIPAGSAGKISRPAFLNSQLAWEAISRAREKAGALGVPMSLSIVDAGGNLLAFIRMDGAIPASIRISQDKAYTAAFLGMPTGQLAALAQPGGPLHGIQTSHRGRIVAFGGGHPLRISGVLAGGIGASGGTVEQDMEVALAGSEAITCL